MIFRPSALRRYNEKTESSVFPMLALPSLRPPFCVLFCLLVIALITSALIEFPIYAKGVAVKINSRSVPAMLQSKLIVLVPPENLSYLKVGQKTFMRTDGKAEVIRGRVSEIIPGLLNPNEVKTRFDLDADSSALLKNGAAIAVIKLDVSERSQLSLDGTERFSDTWIEVGSGRLLTALLGYVAKTGIQNIIPLRLS